MTLLCLSVAAPSPTGAARKVCRQVVVAVVADVIAVVNAAIVVVVAMWIFSQEVGQIGWP